MKKFKEMLEQHREKGRFHPVKPYNVQNTAAASPRPSSDSASVKLKEDLRKWFSKTDPAGDWKRINSKGEAIGPCAREPGEPKPKCMSKEKRASLTKKERASAVRAKRKHDPNPERKGEPINVSNFGKGKISENMENLDEKNVPTSPEKWAQAKAQAKAKFDVYPSAYANGWAAKKYKAMGGGWKSVSEENSLLEKWSQKYKSSIDCDNPKGFSQKAHCDGKEKNEEVVHEGAIPAKEKTVTVRHKTSGKELVVTAQKAKELKQQDYHPVKEAKEVGDEQINDGTPEGLVKKGGKTMIVKPLTQEAKDVNEYDQEGDMAKSDLRSIMANAKRVHDMLEDSDNLPEWVQSKITKAEDYMSTVANYLSAEMSEEVEQIREVSLKTATSAYVKRVGRDETGADPKAAKTISHIANRYGVKGVARAAKSADKEYGLNDPVHNKRKDFVKGVMSGVKTEEVKLTEGIEVKKEYNDKTEAEHGVYHKGKKIGYVVHHKPSGTHTAYHSPQDDDDYGQIDDFRSHHDAVSQIRHSAGVGVHEEVDAAIGLAKPKTSLTAAAKTLAPQTRVAEGSKPPFDKPYTTIKGVITDKSGAKHTPMSRARDIARMAMKKQAEKMKQPVKESLDESRRMEIVREAMKVAKKKKETTVPDDKYQSDPVLSSQITKT